MFKSFDATMRHRILDIQRVHMNLTHSVSKCAIMLMVNIQIGNVMLRSQIKLLSYDFNDLQNTDKLKNCQDTGQFSSFVACMDPNCIGAHCRLYLRRELDGQQPGPRCYHTVLHVE